ncbi:MAG: sigma-54 dependent transcriptional regulator [Phycisphaerales bacterium]
MYSSKKNTEKASGHKQCTTNILIVDNDPQFEQTILKVLAQKAIRGIVAENPKAASDRLEKDYYQLIFLSAQVCPEVSPFRHCSLLKTIKLTNPETPVILTTELDKSKQNNPRELISSTINAVRAGYQDLLLKPVESQRLDNILDRFVPNHSVNSVASASQDTHNLYQIVGNSSKLTQTVELAKCIAPTSAPVLISGESGTGKELISYMIHRQSKRAEGPYVRVNCAALSESLLESELFGHEKGAFTGAYTQRKGRFETAHGGTLLLDEITETPVRFQAKLLRILEQQDFERVGGNDSIKVNVRIITTTNKDIIREVAEQRFRQDLYYRLSTVRIVIAPLRERPDDLKDLVWHFVNIYAAETNRQISKLDPAMMEIFTKYHWPGNIRQLRNVIRTSLILGDGEILSLADVSWLFDELQPRTQQAASKSETSEQLPSAQLGSVPLEHVERQAIIETLRQTDGNQTKAAKVLGISDRTLRCKIKKYRQEGAMQPA